MWAVSDMLLNDDQRYRKHKPRCRVGQKERCYHSDHLTMESEIAE